VDNRVSLVKMSKTTSTSSDLDLSKARKLSNTVTNIQEMDL
jgi:hypothetical protein